MKIEHTIGNRDPDDKQFRPQGIIRRIFPFPGSGA
jgi:hypothetical protein